MKGRELLLIGTVHGDPDGPVRFRDLLQKEHPAVILVEASPYGLAYRRRNGRSLRNLLARRIRRLSGIGGDWKRWGQIQGLFTRTRTPFEYSTALRYCRDKDALFACVDLSRESRRLIAEQWQEMFGLENLEALLREPPEDTRRSFAQTYALASRLISERERSCLNPYVREWMEDPAWREREAHLAEEIRNRFDRMTAGLLVYVGGWQHLLCPTDAGTVCDRVAHLRPRRILLG